MIIEAQTRLDRIKGISALPSAVEVATLTEGDLKGKLEQLMRKYSQSIENMNDFTHDVDEVGKLANRNLAAWKNTNDESGVTRARKQIDALNQFVTIVSPH